MVRLEALCLMIWIQTGWFRERDKKNPGELGSFTGNCIMAHVWKYPQIPGRDCGQKELKTVRRAGPQHKRTPPRSLSVPQHHARLHSPPCTPSSSPVKSKYFLYPSSPFFRSLKRKVLVCLSPRTQPPPSWPGILVGLGTNSSSMKWTRPPALHTTLCQTACTLVSLYLQITGGGFLHLYKYKLRLRGPTVRWVLGCEPKLSHPELSNGKQRLPESTIILCFHLHAWELNAYGALSAAARLFSSNPVRKSTSSPILIEKSKSHKDRITTAQVTQMQSVPEPGKWKKFLASVYCFSAQNPVFTPILLLSSPHRTQWQGRDLLYI